MPSPSPSPPARRARPSCLPNARTGSAQASWGSERVAHVGDYTIQNWQIEEGLPQISVTSIAQTPDGYLWIGTFNGLARFDGARFTVFHEGNYHGRQRDGSRAPRDDSPEHRTGSTSD